MYERLPTTSSQNPPRNTTFPFQNNTLMFQQHQGESLYDAWTRFKNLIQRVPHHGLNLWSLTQFFYYHVNNNTRMDLDFVVDGNLRELSGEEAWEAIDCFAQGQKEEVICFDETKPQPPPLPNFPPLVISLGDKRGLEPPIKPHSPDSFRMKKVDQLTNHTPPSPHMESFHPKDTYFYYHPCIGDPKKHYGFKPGLLGQSGSLGVDFLKLEMIEDDLELESKKVSFLGSELNSPVRPKEVENVIFDEKKLGSRKAHLLEDKQIPSVVVFDKVFSTWMHLEEIHVTWAHLEKKRTRLRTCTKIHQEVLFSERRDCVTGIKRRCRDLSGDGVWILVTESQRSRLKVDLEPSTWRQHQKHQATLLNPPLDLLMIT
ncbi:hypothetical protein Tco_0541307 [Tanacetum coccineum]